MIEIIKEFTFFQKVIYLLISIGFIYLTVRLLSYAVFMSWKDTHKHKKEDE